MTETDSIEGTRADLIEPDEIRWKTSPLDKHGGLLILATFAITTAASTAAGLAIVEWWDTNSAGEVDSDLIQWLEDNRTPAWSDTSAIISNSGDSIAKVISGVLFIPLFLWCFRRWHEYALIVGGLVLEVCIFGLSSELVGRDRPPVEQLDGAPTNSFPSGHIAAAAVFYGGIALVFFMRTRSPGLRAVGVVIAVVGTVATTFARLYQGMHYATDAVASLVIAAIVLWVMWRVVHRTLPADESPDAHDRAVAARHSASVA